MRPALARERELSHYVGTQLLSRVNLVPACPCLCAAGPGNLGRRMSASGRSAPFDVEIVNGRVGWICDGPLCDGENRNRTFIRWLDLVADGERRMLEYEQQVPTRVAAEGGARSVART
jgi:hypothetical protein